MSETNQLPLPTGSKYLTCYSGILNIIEEILNLLTIFSFTFIGYTLEGHTLNVCAVIASLCTAAFLTLHIKGVIRQSRLAWYWIECVSVLLIAISYAIFATFCLSVYTQSYIIVSVISYICSAVYFLDSFDKYRSATSPVIRYAWTMPNMPDLG